MSQNPLIDVAVLGKFKAGKSSFLNSLIGKPILPVGVTPVTTLITRLQFGQRERAIATYFDGTVHEVDFSEVETFTSETRNPGNEKNVEVVDIELPSLQECAGLRLVDTPGLGSVFKYHRETSENWLPEVGAAVLGRKRRSAFFGERPCSYSRINPAHPENRYSLNQSRPFIPGTAGRSGRIFQNHVDAVT